MPSSAAMPSEHHPPPHAQQQPEQSQQQIKLCSACHRPLSADSATTPLLLHDGEDASDTTIVCPPCRTRILAARIESPPVSAARGEVLFAQVERELRRRAASLQSGDNEADSLHPLAEHINRPQDPRHPASTDEEDVDMDSPVAPPPRAVPAPATEPSSHRPAFVEGPSCSPPSGPSPARRALSVVVNHGAAPHQPQAPSSSQVAHSPVALAPWASASTHRAPPAPHPSSAHPDPLADITRLRVRSQGHHCLYPGAIFQGTQKSGRNSYDVSVTIVVSRCAISAREPCG